MDTIKSREAILMRKNDAINMELEEAQTPTEPTPAPGNTPNELDRSETVGTGNTQIDVELRPRKKKPVGILGPSKTRAASLKRGSGIGTSQRPTTHAELLHLVDSLKNEKSDMNDHIKSLVAAKDHLQSRVTKLEKTECRLKEEMERGAHRLSETEAECNALRQTAGRLDREQKQRESSAKADGVRLARQEEQIQKLKDEEKNLKVTVKELSNELNNHKEVARKQLNLKDKQIEQLVDGFQKQMQLIDVLRRQKLHLEAAQILQYTEDEFLQTLDWTQGKKKTPALPHPEANQHLDEFDKGRNSAEDGEEGQEDDEEEPSEEESSGDEEEEDEQSDHPGGEDEESDHPGGEDEGEDENGQASLKDDDAAV